MKDYRNFKRDPVTNKIFYADPDDLIRRGPYATPKRPIGMGLTPEQKTWLWKNWKYNSNSTFDSMAVRFNNKFSDQKLKKADIDIMKSYRRYGEVIGFKSYLANKTFTATSAEKK